MQNTPPDFFFNQMGNVLVLAPAPSGRFRHLIEERHVALNQGSDPTKALSRWIFADIPERTLTDDWGNPYDHQVHFLLAGDLEAGKGLMQALESEGFVLDQAEEFFVPFQTLDPNDRESSDALRQRHARAFALARRERPTVRDLATSIRDSIVVGG
ncbi:MAG: hypothetical protein AAFS10_22475 [Myxococcota bacterium]